MIYLKNKDLLEEIRKSKDTYSSYETKDDIVYDIILPSIEKINIRSAAQAKRNRAGRLAKQSHINAIAEIVDKKKKPKLAEFTINWKKVPKTDLIFRINTYEHIPKAPGRVKTPKSDGDLHEKLPFPPYKHYRYNEDNELICVGISHWEGTIKKGKYNKEHGKMTDMLAQMFMKLCDRYGSRSNWRGYCVDEKTTALTNRGWLTYDDITDNDRIVSYNPNTGHNIWSSIKSIYSGKYNGLMHRMTCDNIDALITPEHKIVTANNGLVPIERLEGSDKIIVQGNDVIDTNDPVYPNGLVELIGWIITDGSFDAGNITSTMKNICIYQNTGKHANNVRTCLKGMDIKFTESTRRKNVNFKICEEDSIKLAEHIPQKNLTMEFIINLTQHQRHLLIETMIDNSGWQTGNKKVYSQPSMDDVDMFQALCALSGYSTCHTQEQLSFGEVCDYNEVTLFPRKDNQIKGKRIDLHGGKQWDDERFIKHEKLNKPTVSYNGIVWCPETEFGSFIARRNGKVYLTGNTYNDEMRGQAIIQLVQVGLLFNEFKSQNPFAYYTRIVQNSFTKILNTEKRHQAVRDDILEMNNLMPSYTRQNQQVGTEFDNNLAKESPVKSLKNGKKLSDK